MKVLVLSETDACCGPMAAAFLCDYSTAIEAVSAGRNPSQSIEPMVVEAMKECLIDLTAYHPRDLKTLDMSAFDVVYECLDQPCPTTMEACRELRDAVKNEAFLFFRRQRQRIADFPNSQL